MDDHQTPTNDLNAAVTKFCLALERDRRTPEGRIRSEHDFRQHFFPYDENTARDRVLRFMPRPVRGPIIASWGIRGHKAAMRDDDPRVRAVVHDAFVAGDIDDLTFEEGISSDLITAWAELADWWKFYRAGKHSKYSIQRALEYGYEFGMFDAKWFFDVLESGGGKLHGTDVLVEGMSKTELADWIKKIHESGDGTPRGLLTALGWSTLVAKTSNAVLLAAVDAFAAKNGLVKERFRADEDEGPRSAARPSQRPEVDPTPPRSAASTPSGVAAVASVPVVSPSAVSDWADQFPNSPATLGNPADAVPGEDALLSELETPAPGEDADWLENPVSVATDQPDDLDVELDGQGESGDVTQVFDRPSDAQAAPETDAQTEAETTDEEPQEPHGVAASLSAIFRGKAHVPGIPAGKGKTVPPPLPEKNRK